jgi:hypothetical protein
MVGALGCYTTAASAHHSMVLRGCEASMGSAQPSAANPKFA